MKLSELIYMLDQHKQRHGDIQVFTSIDYEDHNEIHNGKVIIYDIYGHSDTKVEGVLISVEKA